MEFIERSRQFRRLLQMVNPREGNNVQDIYFDLETSGLKPGIHEILQVAAITKNDETPFNIYIMPSQRIESSTTAINKMDVAVVENELRLRVRKQPVPTFSLEVAMKKFIQFLEDQAGKGKINLVGHNGVEFDYPFLYKALTETNLLNKFTSIVYSFTDTLHAFRDAFPDRSNKQADLVNDYLPEFEYQPHNALEDVRALAALRKKKVINESYFQNCTYTFDSVTKAVENVLVDEQ